MTFIRKTGQEQNKLLSGGMGGVAGEGAAVSGATQKTDAGSPGGWTNIQDFMGANKQKPTAQTRIEQGASQQLGQATQQLGAQVSGLSQMPTADKYSDQQFSDIRKGGITGGESQQMRGYLDQSFGGAEQGVQDYEKSAQDQIQGVQDPFSGMKSGDFGSIMNWYGDVERPSATYTSGMQKMDEMLMRGNKDFAKDMPKQMAQQFQTQVTDVMNKERTDLTNRQNIAKQQFSDEGKQWYEGISGFLGGEDQKVKDRYAQQQSELELENQRSNQDVMGNYYSDLNPFAGNARYGEQDQTGLNPLDYIKRDAVYDPSMGTAATAQFSPEQLNTYNALSGLTADAGYGQYTGGEIFDPGRWNMNEDKFKGDYVDMMTRGEENVLQNEIDRIKGLAPVQYYGGQNPQADMNLSYFDVPEYLDTKYGQGDIGLNEAGSRVWQNTQEIEKPTSGQLQPIQGSPDMESSPSAGQAPMENEKEDAVQQVINYIADLAPW